jgi:antitoxin ParD1/3/4
MNVSLTPELENFVNEKVKSGLYNSASEVLRESLRLLKERDMLKEIQRNELRREIMLGVNQIRNGEYTSINSQQELESFTENLISEARRKYAKQNQE